MWQANVLGVNLTQMREVHQIVQSPESQKSSRSSPITSPFQHNPNTTYLITQREYYIGQELPACVPQSPRSCLKVLERSLEQPLLPHTNILISYINGMTDSFFPAFTYSPVAVTQLGPEGTAVWWSCDPIDLSCDNVVFLGLSDNVWRPFGLS